MNSSLTKICTARFIVTLLGVLAWCSSATALESHIGTIMVSSEITCLNECDNYYLQPDTGYTIYYLRGADLVLYVGRHCEVYGYRSYCGACLVVNVTTVARLPITDVQLIDDRMPGATQLLQNYPNPFNPATTIGYELGSYGHVSLTIYDVTGRSVATLVNSDQPPGKYEVTWNAYDVPSGMYFYNMVTPSGTFRKKMLVVK